MDGARDILHVAGVEPADVDAARVKQVDVVLLHQMRHLPVRQPREREQPDLLHDVLPRPGRAQSETGG